MRTLKNGSLDCVILTLILIYLGGILAQDISVPSIIRRYHIVQEKFTSCHVSVTDGMK